MSSTAANNSVLDGSVENNETTTTIDSDHQATRWSVGTVIQAIVLFFATGFAEIGGGWLVWKYVRDKKPRWWGVLGSITLVIYGFLPTLQPTNEFGRIYAVYGGFFIVLSFLAGWGLDGDRPDLGDVVGGIICLTGVLIILFWPRK